MARVRDWLGVQRNRRTGGICGGRVAHPTSGTSGRGCGSPVTETRCATLSLLSTPRDKFGCGRSGGNLSKAWHGPALMDMLPGRGGRRLDTGQDPRGRPPCRRAPKDGANVANRKGKGFKRKEGGERGRAGGEVVVRKGGWGGGMGG